MNNREQVKIRFYPHWQFTMQENIRINSFVTVKNSSGNKSIMMLDKVSLYVCMVGIKIGCHY